MCVYKATDPLLELVPAEAEKDVRRRATLAELAAPARGRIFLEGEDRWLSSWADAPEIGNIEKEQLYFDHIQIDMV